MELGESGGCLNQDASLGLDREFPAPAELFRYAPKTNANANDEKCMGLRN
jgi:hypothetical protein